MGIMAMRDVTGPGQCLGRRGALGSDVVRAG